jgi:hypothetical protein
VRRSTQAPQPNTGIFVNLVGEVLRLVGEFADGLSESAETVTGRPHWHAAPCQVVSRSKAVLCRLRDRRLAWATLLPIVGQNVHGVPVEQVARAAHSSRVNLFTAFPSCK